MAQEKPGQTLRPTALVNEAYLRLVGPGEDRHWASREHFFAAAAEAMRRILVENARRKGREKHGGRRRREQVDPEALDVGGPPEDLLDLHEAEYASLAIARRVIPFPVRGVSEGAWEEGGGVGMAPPGFRPRSTQGRKVEK
jgi:hypothetical protein